MKICGCFFHSYERGYFGLLLRRWRVYHAPCGATFRWLGKD